MNRMLPSTTLLCICLLLQFQGLAQVIDTPVDTLVGIEDSVSIKVFDPSLLDYSHQPSYLGGTAAIAQFIRKNLVLPPCCQRVIATVYVAFEVDSLGQLKHVQVVPSLSSTAPYLHQEMAVRLVKSMPDWQPAIQGEEAISAWTIVPIAFRLR